jgi:four helix bundle protein
MRGIKKLLVGDVALEAIGALRPVVDGIRRRDRALSEQLVRAMTSVALSVTRAEFPVQGTRRGHILAAVASASEAQAVLHIAVDCAYCTRERAKPARVLLDKTQAMLCRLARRR